MHPAEEGGIIPAPSGMTSCLSSALLKMERYYVLGCSDLITPSWQRFKGLVVDGEPFDTLTLVPQARPASYSDANAKNNPSRPIASDL